MRQPTPIASLLEWHRDALAGKRPPIHDGEPHVGWFKVRMVKGGPFVPARIWVEREICPNTGELEGDERLFLEVEGERLNLMRHWVWLSKNPISKAEFDHLFELRSTIDGMSATHVPFDVSDQIIRPQQRKAS